MNLKIVSQIGVFRVTESISGGIFPALLPFGFHRELIVNYSNLHVLYVQIRDIWVTVHFCCSFPFRITLRTPEEADLEIIIFED